MQVLGVDIGRLWLWVFGLGIGLAALGGVLAAPMRSVNPEMGNVVLAEAFAVTVIGGLGSLVAPSWRGFSSASWSMTALFAPEMATIAMFAFMALVLLVRPQGLFGTGGGRRDLTIERRSGRRPVAAAPARFSRRAPLSIWRSWRCPSCCRRRRSRSTS